MYLMGAVGAQGLRGAALPGEGQDSMVDSVAAGFGAVSDDFATLGVDPVWDYKGIAGTAQIDTDPDDAFIQIASPLGVRVDASSFLTSPRLLQDVNDTDFQVSAGFLTDPQTTFQEHGLLFVEDDSNYIRFDTAFTTLNSTLIIGIVTNGTVDWRLFQGNISPDDARHLRVTREGDQWSFERSADGARWTEVSSFRHDLDITEAGLFAGSTSFSGTAPGYTAEIDYFEVTGDPITDEDGDLEAVREQPPLDDGDDDGDQTDDQGEDGDDDDTGGTPIDVPDSLIAFWDSGQADRFASTLGSQSPAGGVAINGASLDGETVSFDGSNDFLRIPHQPLFNQARGTLTVWFQSDGSGSAQGLVGKIKNDWGIGEFFVKIEADNRLTLLVENGFQTFTTLTTTQPVVTDTDFHHLAITWGDGEFRFYLDGVQLSGQLTTNGRGLGTSDHIDFDLGGLQESYGGQTGNSQPLLIGAILPGTGNVHESYLNGSVDNVGLFEAVLSDGEIAAQAADADRKPGEIAEVSDEDQDADDDDGDQTDDDADDDTPDDTGATDGDLDIRFFLVDAGTDADLRELTDGDTIDRQNLSNGRFNIRTEVDGTEAEDSVAFYLNGSLERTESLEPYALFADVGGTDYRDDDLTDGAYTVRAEAYDADGATGTLLLGEDLGFTIVDSASDDTGGDTGSGDDGPDDDSDAVPQTLTITPDAADQAEGDAGTTALTFTVMRSGSTDGTASVTYTVTGATDAADFGGTVPSGVIAFADGESSQTLTLSVSGDTDVEADEPVLVTLSAPVNAEIGGSGTASATILNDDTPAPPPSDDADLRFFLVDAGNDEDIRELTNGETIDRQDLSNGRFNIRAEVDGTTSAASLTFFIDGAFERVENFEPFALFADVLGTTDYNDDDLGEDTFTVQATAYDGAGATGAVIVSENLTVTVIDDIGTGDTGSGDIGSGDTGSGDGDDDTDTGDTGSGDTGSGDGDDDTGGSVASTLTIIPNDATHLEGNTGQAAITFLVTRSGDLSAAASATFTVSGDVDADDFGGTLPSGLVSFAPGETAQKIIFRTSGDTLPEDDETVIVTLDNPVNASIEGTGSAEGLIRNDDGTPPAETGGPEPEDDDDETPPSDEAPTDEEPADEEPANNTPADETSVDETPADDTPDMPQDDAALRFILVDAGNDTDLGELTSGDTIDRQDLSNGRFNIRAEVIDADSAASAESMTFFLNGSLERTENFEPYAVFADLRGTDDYFDDDLGEESYTLLAQVFDTDGGGTTPLLEEGLAFTVIDSELL